MYDQKNKKAKIVWTREYDLETERAIVIMSNMKYKVWLQWGVYNRLDNVIDAPRKTLGMLDVKEPKIMTVPVPPEPAA